MNKAVRIAVIVVVLALLAWPLFIVANWMTARSVYHHFVGSVSETLGWNRYLIHALVLACLVPFFYGVKLFFSPLSRARRSTGALLLTGMSIAYNLAFYFATRDLAFGFGHGQVLKYYARTDKGIVFYDRPGFDQATGQELKPVTRDVIRELTLLQEGPLTKVDPAGAAWFNPYTGKPQLWYYRFPDGELEFYNKPGMHPQTGDPLSPVTRELFLSWREGHGAHAGQPSPSPGIVRTAAAPAAKANARMERFRETLVAGAGHGATGLLVLGRDETEREAAEHLARHLPGFDANVFRTTTLQREGFGTELYDGNADLLRETMSVTQLGSLVVVQVSVLCEKRSQLDPDLLSCDVTANARKFDARGNPAGSASAHGTGAGFNRTDAVEQAAQRAAPGLNQLAPR